MKKILFGAMVLASASALAQETYENTNLLNPDLNGTARYVGMGGAMDALGADISTISTNPAGVGLFRRSSVNVSAGLNSQAEAGESRYADATNASFDQIGLVWANTWDGEHFLNFGFNYHKSKNLNQILNVEGPIGMGSQHSISYYKNQIFDGIDLKNDLDISGLDALYLNTIVLDDKMVPGFYEAEGFNLSRATKGHINDFDMNISGNVSSQVYLGMTIGIHDVDYTTYSAYTERLLKYDDVNDNYYSIGNITVNDERYVSGTGVDLKFGAIVMPIDESPFRIGLSIATPTWYDLRTEYRTSLINKANIDFTPLNAGYVSSNNSGYDYKVYTPWKFGLSLGHTIDNYIALGASYEYSDYGRTKSRIIDGYDFYGDASSSNDVEMNADTKANLKGVSTLKLGAEVKPTPEVAVRVGYNFVSPTFRKDALKNPFIWSEGTYNSSQADYTNWKSTNRLTCGVGYSKGNFSADIAYQFSTTKGSFHPFVDCSDDIWYDDNHNNIKEPELNEVEEFDCWADAVNVKNNRHQLIATLTYKF